VINRVLHRNQLITEKITVATAGFFHKT